MDDIINLNFLLLIIIIVFLFRHRKTLYFKKLNNIQENYKNILDINFLDKNKSINKKNLYSLDVNLNEVIPILNTSFKYSLEYKLGYELSKIFRIKFNESLGLNNNLNKLEFDKNYNNLYLCSEVDFYQKYLNNEIKNHSFVCGFYYLHFLMFVRSEIEIESWEDILLYSSKKSNNRILKKLRVGIPNNNSHSYNDAKKLFSCIGININDIKEENNIEIIYESEKDLFGYLKNNINDDNAIDLLYLTTSVKHPYITEYLGSYNINLFSIQGINKDLVDIIYGGNHSFNNRFSKNIFTKINKKKNIYANIGDSFKTIVNEKENNILIDKYINIKSTRLILVAHNKLEKN